MSMSDEEKESFTCHICYDLKKKEFRCLEEDLILSAKECYICNMIITGTSWARDELRVNSEYGQDDTLYYVYVPEQRPGKSRSPLQVQLCQGKRLSPYCQIYTLPDVESSWPLLGTGYDLERALDINVTVAWIHCWVKACTEQHRRCQNKHQSMLPTRVVDVGLFESDAVRLYESEPSENARYVALSYCWGGQENLKTTYANLEAHKDSIEWASIPSTIQDAIQLTRRLQIRYIWIDALCIIQDNPVDWDSEAVKMADYYQGAYFVICATRSATASSGIFGDRIPAQCWLGPGPASFTTRHYKVSTGLLQPDITIHSRETLGYHHGPTINFPDSMDNPLSFRAWAFQERLLATRAVCFTAEEIIWECREAAWCECGTVARQSNVSDFDNVLRGQNTTYTQRPDVLWQSLVKQYSRRSITFPTDKLAAFEGIAQRFQALNPGRYCYGLWENYLVVHLCWYADTARIGLPVRGSRDTTFPLTSENESVIIGPSWSWISANYPVTFPLYDYEDPIIFFVEIQHFPDLSSPSDLREIIVYPPRSWNRWRLTLTAKVVEARVVDKRGRSSWYEWYKLWVLPTNNDTHDQTASFHPDVRIHDPFARESSAMARWKWINDGDIVKCVLLATKESRPDYWIGVAVKQTENDPNMHIRVGMVDCSGSGWTLEDWDTVETSTITLI